MKLPHASIPAMLCAGVVAFHVPGVSAALPDHGLMSAAGATGLATRWTDDASLVEAKWPAFLAGAQIDYGENHAQSLSATSNTLAYAGSLWWDRYTISGGGAGPGSAGFSALLGGSLQTVGAAGAGVGYVLVISDTLPASFDFDFSSLTATNASSWLDAQLAANTPGGATVLAKLVDTASGLSNKKIDETFSGSFDFTYGKPFYIGAALLTGVGIGSGSGAARADFLDTATFSLTLKPEDTLTMASSVPEPGEWAMLLAGLGLIGLRLRMRRQPPG